MTVALLKSNMSRLFYPFDNLIHEASHALDVIHNATGRLSVAMPNTDPRDPERALTSMHIMILIA